MKMIALWKLFINKLDSKEIHDYEIKAQLGKFGIIDETQKIKELIRRINLRELL